MSKRRPQQSLSGNRSVAYIAIPRFSAWQRVAAPRTCNSPYCPTVAHLPSVSHLLWTVNKPCSSSFSSLLSLSLSLSLPPSLPPSSLSARACVRVCARVWALVVRAWTLASLMTSACLICVPYMYALYACMYALYACLICVPYMRALYACLICMPYMHTVYACLI